MVDLKIKAKYFSFALGIKRFFQIYKKRPSFKCFLLMKLRIISYLLSYYTAQMDPLDILCCICTRGHGFEPGTPHYSHTSL